MRRVREDHLHRTIVRCQRTAFKVQSETHPAKSRCGDLSCNDPVSPEQTACPATDASNGGSSRDPREVRVLLGAAKRRFVQPPAVRGVVSNRTEQKIMEELGKQFDKLLGEAANADDAETYVERFQSLSEGMEDLKRRKAGILQIRQEQDAVSRRLQASEAALDAVSAQITEWDEKTVYQLLEKVTVMEGFKIRVTFRNGQEIEQSIDQPKRRKRI